MAENDLECELAKYMKYLQVEDAASLGQASADSEEIRTSPLFSWLVKKQAERSHSEEASGSLFRQYALLGQNLSMDGNGISKTAASPIFLNTNAPWSAFLCGSQGSGKSYTLSCILESCLLQGDRIGKTPSPLAGYLFHYDPQFSGGICEAAYLASDIPVRVLVSPSNYFKAKQLYEERLPGRNQMLIIQPLLFSGRHLNTDRILKLMAFNDKEGSIPLYLEHMLRILRDMAVESKGSNAFNYDKFVSTMRLQTSFNKNQVGPLEIRMQLLDSFMVTGTVAKKLPVQKISNFDDSQPGHLTIIDLTDPFIDCSTACVLFDICLALFLENASSTGKVIALDEAHKFMNGSAASEMFTESLLTTIREQRHKAARIVIATQEPTISPKLLDLCSMTIVHRFTSPEWFKVLKDHIAGATSHVRSRSGKLQTKLEEVDKERGEFNVSSGDLFDEIVNLGAGESLLFSPSAMLAVTEAKVRKLGKSYIKFKTRKRITEDGGQSLMAK